MSEGKADQKTKDDALKIDVKDALLFVPFVGSALAITWETGFFLVIKGSAFGMFSLTEHLTFALQALPIALLFALMVLVVPLQLAVMERIMESRLFARRQPARWHFIVGGLTLGAIVLALGLYLKIASYTTLGSIMVFATVARTISARLFFQPIMLSSLGLVTAFVLAMSLGVDIARAELRSNRPLNIIELSEKDSQPQVINVRILRTGERGILHYTPSTGSFGLTPWDTVKTLRWDTSPLIGRTGS